MNIPLVSQQIKRSFKEGDVVKKCIVVQQPLKRKVKEKTVRSSRKVVKAPDFGKSTEGKFVNDILVQSAANPNPHRHPESLYG